MEPLLSLVMCGVCGAALSIIELLETFGKWMGRFWFNRYVLALVLLNTVTAAGVYGFLRYILEVESGFWLAVVTGLTFPAILRSNLTFYRTARSGSGQNGLSLRVHEWYRHLEEICYEETNGQIADARAGILMGIGRKLSEKEISAILSAHVASELLAESRAKHAAKLEAIQEVPDAGERLLRLAAFTVEILPDRRVRTILKSCQ